MTMAVLQAENLHKRYYLGSEPIDVLRGVDIAVEPGQWLAVVGRRNRRQRPQTRETNETRSA